MRFRALQPSFLCMALEHLESNGEASLALWPKQVTR